MKNWFRRHLLLTAGWLAPGAGQALAAAMGSSGGTGDYELVLREDSSLQDTVITFPQTLNQGIDNIYAAHRSHRSHSSHRSHYSSSSGRGYYTPSPPAGTAPSGSPTAAPFTRDTSPNPDGSRVTPESPQQAVPRPLGDDLVLLIMRVQLALRRSGYDPGAVDGVMSQGTQDGLRKFQREHGIQATGTMTTETLDALGVRLSR